MRLPRSLRSTPLAAAATLLTGTLLGLGTFAVPTDAHANTGTTAVCVGQRAKYRARNGFRYENGRQCYTSLEQFPNISLQGALRIIDDLNARRRSVIPDGFTCVTSRVRPDCSLLARTRDQRTATFANRPVATPTLVSTPFLRRAAGQ